MSSEPVDVVREIFRRFADGDDPFPLLDENVTWDVPMVDGHYVGHRGVAEFFRHWIGTWDDYKIVLENIMEAPDGRVVAMFCEEGSGRGSGVPVHLHPASVWEIRDGRAVAYQGYLDQADALRDVGLGV
jgi:ketosteroid isomerase-like protein